MAFSAISIKMCIRDRYLYGFMLAGLAVGLLLSGRINQRTARRVTGWMIVASGAGVLLAEMCIRDR